MYEIRMVGTTAELYSDVDGLLRSIDDIEARVEELSERFVVESVSLAAGVELPPEEMSILNSDYLLVEIQKKNQSATEKRDKHVQVYSPIKIFFILKSVMMLMRGNLLAMLLCWCPVLLVAFVGELNFLGSLVSDLNNDASIKTGLILLLLFSLWAYLKTVTSLHDYFLNAGRRKRLLSYFLLSMQDIHFVLYNIIIFLRVGIILSLIVAPLLLIGLFLLSSGVDLAWFAAPVLFALMATLYYFYARYVMALPAIIAKCAGCRTTWSFAVTRGNGWRIMCSVFLLPVMIEALIGFIVPLTGGVIWSAGLRLIYLSLGVGMLVGCFVQLTEGLSLEKTE